MASSARTGDAARGGTGGSDDVGDLGRAWGWVAALRDGATTPWADWTTAAEPAGRHLPGAQQLELLRRLNASAGRGALPAGLAGRVLEASAPGRGRPDLELVGAAAPSRFGPAPVDPAALGAHELLRVAGGLLADDLVAAGVPDPPAARTRPWTPAREVGGDPWVAPWVRAELAALGRPPGRRRATAYVVGADLGTLLGHAWTARALDEGGGTWREWLRGFVRTDRTPARADLAGHARFWAERVGRRRVHVVADPDLLPGLLLGRSGRRRLSGPPVLSADAVELARRVGSPLGMLVLPERRRELLRRVLAPRLDADAPPLAVPEAWHPWLAERAEHARDRLARDGYAVHGDLDALLAPPRPGTEPDDDRVLALALDLLLRPTAASRGGSHR